MPKAVALTSSLVEAPQLTPQAATPARITKEAPVAKADQMPLQVRWPRAAVRAVKIAAAENEQTVSDFMLAWRSESDQPALMIQSLTPAEIEALRTEMAEAGDYMRRELAQRGAREIEPPKTQSQHFHANMKLGSRPKQGRG